MWQCSHRKRCLSLQPITWVKDYYFYFECNRNQVLKISGGKISVVNHECSLWELLMFFWYDRYWTQNEVALFESHCHRQDELNVGLRVGGCLVRSDHDPIDFKFGKWRRMSTNIFQCIWGTNCLVGKLMGETDCEEKFWWKNENKR